MRDWVGSWSKDVLEAALLVGDAGDGGEAIVSATTRACVKHSGSSAGGVVVDGCQAGVVNHGSRS